MAEPSSILIQNIFHMLCYAFKILRQKNYREIATEDFAHVQDMLAAILCRGISQQLKQGLYRSYISVDERSSALRGKVNLYETKKLQTRKMQQFDCSYDEFSPDNELNRILKAACMALIRRPDIAEKQRTGLRQLIPFFSSLSDIDLNAVHWNRLQFHRNNRSYEMLMNICYMIWKSLLPSTVQGSTRFSLFEEESLPKLYEKFILKYYCQHFPELKPKDKMIQWDVSEETPASMIRLLPGMHSDIMLCNGGLTLIIDAKFYRHAVASYMEKQMLHSANLYQIYTYVKNEDRSKSGNVSGMLLYAKTTEETQPFLSANLGGNQISVRSLDLNRSFSGIAASLDEIAYHSFGTSLKKVV